MAYHLIRTKKYYVPDRVVLDMGTCNRAAQQFRKDNPDKIKAIRDAQKELIAKILAKEGNKNEQS